MKCSIDVNSDNDDDLYVVWNRFWKTIRVNVHCVRQVEIIMLCCCCWCTLTSIVSSLRYQRALHPGPCANRHDPLNALPIAH